MFLSPRHFYELGIKDGFTIDNPLHFRTEDFERLGIEVIDNTNVEIREATAEMYNLLEERNLNNLDLARSQINFWDAFPNDVRLDVFGKKMGRIGENFLQQNPWLIK